MQLASGQPSPADSMGMLQNAGPMAKTGSPDGAMPRPQPAQNGGQLSKPPPNQTDPGGDTTAPGGALPGSKDYWDWYTHKFNQDQFSPGGTMSEIMSLANMVGGIRDPMGSFGNMKNPTMWNVGNRAMASGMGWLNRSGVGIGQQPVLGKTNVERTPLNWDTYGKIAGSGADLGREAAGMIPDQGVRSVQDLSKTLHDVSPGVSAVVDAATPALQQIEADAAAGNGLMGIPMSAVEKMQGQNIAQANLAEQAMLDQLGISSAAAGTGGQGAADQAIATQMGTSYAPARIAAMQDPLELSYKLGPDVMNALSNSIARTEVPLTELAGNMNLNDLQRQMQGKIAGANVFGDLAGRGIQAGANLMGDEQKVGQSAANLQGELDFKTGDANLDAWLKQQSLLAPYAFGSPWKGYDAVSGSINDRNKNTMDLIKMALGESDKLRQLHVDRKAQELQESLGMIGGISGSIGNLIGGGGLGDFAGGLMGTGGGGTGAGLLGAATGDIGAGIGSGVGSLLGLLGL